MKRIVGTRTIAVPVVNRHPVPSAATIEFYVDGSAIAQAPRARHDARFSYTPDYVSLPSETLAEAMRDNEHAVFMSPGSPTFWLNRMRAYEQYMEARVRVLTIGFIVAVVVAVSIWLKK